MQSLWNEVEAARCADKLALRVYSSRLLGREPDLVLHGGGNTSVKIEETNRFGEREALLYVKGSGWDLATIEVGGFAPVRLATLQKMAALEQLSDAEMVQLLRAAMTDAAAPNPSVEAILHAIIPFTFVDHTHADAVVTLCNSKNGEDRVRTLYGERVLVVPYVMPGFALARKVYELARDIDWADVEGMILMHHGVFTFADDARESYERMIRLVRKAEAYLAEHAAVPMPSQLKAGEDLIALARLRRAVSRARGRAMIARLDQDAASLAFAALPDVAALATRGPLTPDHVIRTKPKPLLLNADIEAAVDAYVRAYQNYFARNTDGSKTCLDPAPRWAVWPGYGTVCFGDTATDAAIVADIKDHTIRAIRLAEALGGWRALPEKDIFAVEYWELEQAKLARGGKRPPMQGKVALVTGAASGIGRACAQALHAKGAAVVALDINADIEAMFAGADLLGMVCDVTDEKAMKRAVEETVRHFGGLDIVISNAGIFPPSCAIEAMDRETWDKSLAINLSSHQRLLAAAIPYLKLGLEAAVVIIASKNVPAPGPGAGAYSVAKAGLTQLARVAALELAGDGIRVNVLHPHAVFDTAIWTPEVLHQRARCYGMSVEEYKRNNLLKVEITSRDVAALACALAGPLFAKTTGAQIPIDGGSERVI